MWKVLSFASFNPLGPVVFVEVGAFIVKEAIVCNVRCCLYNKIRGHRNKTYLKFFFSCSDGWLGPKNQEHWFLGGSMRILYKAD